LTAARVTLTGYCHSVYSRAARIALLEKRVDFDWCEVDPFADPTRARAVHPFGRVPVLTHGGFALYETAAITAYVDAAFPGPALSPLQPQVLARMVQVIGLCDSYLYWPLVRQVYAHRVFRPAFGEPSCDQTARAGLAEASRILAALEALAADGAVLSGAITRADCHLAPMIAAFVQVPEGWDMLARFPALSAWWAGTACQPCLRGTETPLPKTGHGG
jgi:glutathione S-transferase